MNDAPKRVLIVDDDVFLRDMYAKKFSDMNHEIETASSASEATDALKRGEFDVMLLDLVMPGTDGFEFLSQVRAEGLLKNAKLIVLTNQSRHEDIEKARNFGANGYIVKASAIPTEVVVESMKIVDSDSPEMIVKQ